MSDQVEYPRLPKKIGETVEFAGKSSGEPVNITKQNDELYVINLPGQPQYIGYLKTEGVDSYELSTPPGVFAIGGTGLSWQDVVDNF